MTDEMFIYAEVGGQTYALDRKYLTKAPYPLAGKLVPGEPKVLSRLPSWLRGMTLATIPVAAIVIDLRLYFGHVDGVSDQGAQLVTINTSPTYDLHFGLIVDRIVDLAGVEAGKKTILHLDLLDLMSKCFGELAFQALTSRLNWRPGVSGPDQ